MEDTCQSSGHVDVYDNRLLGQLRRADGMRSRAGVRQRVQHHVALVHVALERQGESQRRLQHHLVLI